MLNLLDQLIRTVLDTGWVAPPAKPKFAFSIPNDDWVARVKSGADVQLDIYFYEVRENRDFRRPYWDVIAQPGATTAVLSAPPAYFDCHYLISAWSPVVDAEGATTLADEHRVLAEALRILLRNPDVRPVDLGIVGGSPVFQNAHVYLTVAPAEAPRVLNDFWSTMKQPWRPAIQLVATAPIDLLQDSPAVPLMTMLVQRTGPVTDTGAPGGGAPGDFGEMILFGGWVLRNADNTPIGEATVERLNAANGVLETTKTDVQGRFSFAGLRRGSLRLRASAPGLAPSTVTVSLPGALAAEHVIKLS